ncbi:helix-turn-helix domain-containing protein [Nonomuraea sp. NPDC049269]|uniref:helix-turn-helix domain-containing protein n=1 Tax=Nonomuraea sp. NPDC049269 TaxID=3364349 RepID=UPI0037239B94
MAAAPSDLIQSVSRALRVLEEVARADRPLTVKVIARRCGLNLSTSYHLVRTLCYEGYLHRRQDGDYVLGTKVAERFHEMLGAFGRPPRAGAVLRHLAASTGHTAYLARLSAGRVVVVEVAEGPWASRRAGWPSRLPRPRRCASPPPIWR